MTERTIVAAEAAWNYLDLETWGNPHGVSARTVRRWADAGEIPGAGKLAGKWAIPRDAVHQTATTVVAVARERTPQPATATVASILAPLPALLDLATASPLVGVSVRDLISQPEYFQLLRFGGKRARWMMPKARILQLNGD